MKILIPHGWMTLNKLKNQNDSSNETEPLTPT